MIASTAGIVLTIIPLILAGIEIAVNKWIRKVTNTYWFWAAIGIFYLLWCICVCFRHYWEDLSRMEIPWGTLMSPKQSLTVSLALLLNICPFANFALAACLIADPTRKAARSISPLVVLASIFVFFFQTLTSSGTQLTWEFVFFGNDFRTDLQYFGHFANFLIGIGVLLNTPKFGWKGAVGTGGYIAGFYTYVTICAYTTGAHYHVSGVTLEDFSPDGIFNFFCKVLPDKPQASMAIFFIGLIVLLTGAILISDLCKRGYFSYGDNYDVCWWKSYNYEKTTIKEPWGWFSHRWQTRHH